MGSGKSRSGRLAIPVHDGMAFDPQYGGGWVGMGGHMHGMDTRGCVLSCRLEEHKVSAYFRQKALLFPG